MLAYVTAHFTDILQIASYVIAAAAAVTALTPSPADDGIVAAIRKVLDFLALNIGHAKNDPNP
jgi:delta-aminolevulinic acid dehydratase/porphobilinogen synthase